MKPKVFITRRLPQPALDLILPACDAEMWQDELPPPREVLLSKVHGINGLLSLLTDKIDALLMDNAPKLKVVSNCAVGFDNIDVPAATQRGIAIGNTPGVLTETTADFAFTLMLSAARRVVEGDRYTRAGNWKTWGLTVLLGQDVFGATLGLVGLGRIGAAMAKRARGFEMRVLYSDPNRREDLEKQLGITYADLDTLLRQADFVSITRSHIRLFRGNRYPPLRGTFFDPGGQAYVLYTKGSIDFYSAYPGLYVPLPLGFRCDQTASTPNFVAREILALTKMNWNNTQFDNSMPITVRAARQVGAILKYLDRTSTSPTSYAYYM